ncbi:DUF4388 domain-containing protein [Aggregicoccus sp. 17bor-14]|uniref:DUF4388 domain-containing protein n=1 Tax=Myxococcaceae TaxID=31 RepID=UPI00129C6FEE|nr:MULTISPECIES: DUF4388 domain-containing protein [Myxococcaceae]MBF5046341.1 DUF4388 domain-containing protein [Simulacricoccus sp. 17bor-14]MRI92061.1 DUF4388 domain-containing protein [Aggregicoccus sp. 17bor-14]
MALQGTLKDFGIADILQLIGQQQKTGTLVLRAKEQEVQVTFRDGSIVRAESTTRRKKDLIGNMLVRAELITEAQLEQALETQRRTLMRLGDVLVSERALSTERFRQMMQLQATETLYRLFTWKNGTYAFAPEEGVAAEPDSESITPLRAESVLMEGFRMVDEWPVIRRTIPHDGLTFELAQPLPAPTARGAGAGAGDGDGEEGGSELRTVGESERRVFALVRPGRTVRKLVDLACLGEFETCKALCNLVSLGHLRARAPTVRLPAVGGAGALRQLRAAAGMLGRLAVSVAVVGTLALVVSRVHGEGAGLAPPAARSFADPAAQRLVSRAQRARIEAALEVFRLERGGLPEALPALVEAGLLSESDLRYPWQEPYHYRRLAGREYVLLPPLR